MKLKSTIKLIILLAGLNISFVFADTDAPVINDTVDQVQDQVPTSDTSNLTLEQRVGVLERQLSAVNQIGLMNHINDLQQQLQALQGQVEQLSHTVKTLQAQSASQYSDLDQRLVKLGNNNIKQNTDQNTDLNTENNNTDNNAGSMSAKTANTNTSVSIALVQSKDSEAYQAAYNKVKASNYTDGLILIKKYLHQYPEGMNAASAHYWAGQMYLLKNDGKSAAHEFEIVIRRYPQNSKIKDANLKLGFAYLLQNKNNQAKIQFKKVIASYPHTSTAELAKANLAKID